MKKEKRFSNGYEGSFPRRDFLKMGGTLGASLWMWAQWAPWLWSEEQELKPPDNWVKPKTNIDSVLNVPRTKYSLPGLFPGKVVQAEDAGVLTGNGPAPLVVKKMFAQGIEKLTGKKIDDSFRLFFNHDDIIGIKVNPMGGKLISTHLELVDEIVAWLLRNGMKPQNIVIWDRFDYMLKDAGFTAERYPGIRIEGMQTMDESAFEETWNKLDTQAGAAIKPTWLDKDGKHVSAGNFDKEVFYWADVETPAEVTYLNKNVFDGKESYFGKLVTRGLTKIINVPVFKNIAHGVSMATKNIAYGSICNCARLHFPLFLYVNIEVMAFPVIRDKLVLNITDGIIGQYDGGPQADPRHQYPLNSLFFATDPIALDTVCHRMMVEKRKQMKINVNEHPRFSGYLHYGQTLGLGIADVAKINYLRV
ncbi:MAG: DUF362 domain-containing protein [Acidobacteria bacterium]|jgi:hypothetical protein|nr:DUF362 domain-containing protein [Acidobacteriota bacterium]